MPPRTDVIDSNQREVCAAFSAQAAHFDASEKQNPILQWMRAQVYHHEDEFLSPGDSIFELNAGTGIDAVHFAQQGHSVFAIDISEGMLHQLQKKISLYHLEQFIQYTRCSFTDLHQLPARQFDHVFSNFGGLNCIPDLRSVASGLPRLLKPGATVTFVIMPKVCPWELLHVLKGKTRFALRRFSRNGTPARVEGHTFTSYYFSPGQIANYFGKRFRIVRLRGLAALSPPPSWERFPADHPRLFRFLTQWDERVATLPPFNRWADHFIITLQFKL